MSNDPKILPPELEIHQTILTPDLLECLQGQMWEAIADNFTIPAVGDIGFVKVCNNSNYGIGTNVYIVGAGFFAVVGRSGTDTLLVQNNGVDGNNAPATIIPLYTVMVPAAPMGPLAFSSCRQAQGYEVLTADFTIPAVGSSDMVTVCREGNYAIGAYVWISDLTSAGWFEIIDNSVAGQIEVQNNGNTLNTAPAAVIAQGGIIVQAPPPVNYATLTGSDTWDPSSIADGGSELKTVVVTGAALGDIAMASFSLDLAGLSISAYVSDTDEVSVVLSNLTGNPVDLASGTVIAVVFGQP